MEKTGKSMLASLSFKTKTVMVLLGLFLIFILQNTEVVEISFLFWDLNISRVIILLGSLITGILIGLVIGMEVFSDK